MPSVESDILQNEKQVIRKAGRTGRRERVCKIYVQRFSNDWEGVIAESEVGRARG